MFASFGLSWLHLGPTQAQLCPNMARYWLIPAPSGPILSPTWLLLAPSGTVTVLSWPRFGLMLAASWHPVGHISPLWPSKAEENDRKMAADDPAVFLPFSCRLPTVFLPFDRPRSAPEPGLASSSHHHGLILAPSWPYFAPSWLLLGIFLATLAHFGISWVVSVSNFP